MEIALVVNTALCIVQAKSVVHTACYQRAVRLTLTLIFTKRNTQKFTRQ